MKLLSLVLIAGVSFAARQPFATEDFWAWRSASDPRISPDGQWIVYVESRSDRAADARFANLWIVSGDGKTRKPLTEGNWRDGSPRWSGDSVRIAWLSLRDGKTQIRTKKVDSGPETEVAAGGRTPLNVAVSPEGTAVAFTARVPAKLAAPAWAPPSILPRLRQAGSYQQIFVAPVAGGEVKQVSGGEFDHFGEPAWSGDGKSILTSRADGQIWSYLVSTGVAKQLTSEPGRNTTPLAASDSTKVAWLGMSSHPQSYNVHKLYVMNADGSRVKLLSGQLDRDPVNLQWSSDSRTVYFIADDHGATHVYAARSDGTARQVTNKPERLRDFSLADNGRAVAVRSTPTEAGDVVTFTVDRVSQGYTLAAPMERLLADRQIGVMEELSYDSGGQTIQAWVVKPPSFDPAKKYPLLVDVRDDPREMYGVDFKLRAQIYASNGFVVLCANPRGTPGYGEQFGNLLPSRYPGDDFDDVMRGVDAVIAKGYVDSQRLTIVGGLVAAWAIGHTDRFHAAVALRPVADWMTNVATKPDGARRAQEWMGGMPWDDPEQYWKHSPVYFAKNFKTPTLVIAGEADVESEELYFALQNRKVDSALLRAGGGKPSDWILELDAVLAWLKR